jgi:hypothetical protein
MSYSIENFCKNNPPYFGGRNFLASNPFLLIFGVIDTQRRGLHLLSGHHKQWGLLQKRQETLP